MREPCILVVRSGERPFSDWGERPGAEILERESHIVETAVVRADALAPPFDLAVFTSQAAVERLLCAGELEKSFRQGLDRGRVAAVGPGTAGALRRGGVEPQMVAASSIESLLAQLPESLQGWRIIWPCGEDAQDSLPEELTRRGAAVERVVLYRKRPKPADPELSRGILDRTLAAFCVTSPAAAQWLLQGLPREAIAALQGVPAVVLGPSSRRFLEGQGFTDIRLSNPGTYAGAATLLARLAAATASE